MAERFSASRAARLMQCHASADLEAAIPGYTPPPEDPDADNAANRGTRAHELLAAIMSQANGDIVKMSKAVAYVADIIDRRRWKRMIEVEWMADWLPSKPTTTPDLVLYLRDEMHIIDWKWGKIPVSPVDNDQLLFYAATFWEFAPMAKEFHLHVVQPWADNMEVWTVSKDDLLHWMVEAINHDDQITHGDKTFKPGDHCLFCPANPHSRGAKGSVYCPTMMDVLYPKRMDDDALFQIMKED